MPTLIDMVANRIVRLQYKNKMFDRTKRSVLANHLFGRTYKISKFLKSIQNERRHSFNLPMFSCSWQPLITTLG